METADYWLMAWEYSIWNATIASLQFWAEDLDLVTLGIAFNPLQTTSCNTATITPCSSLQTPTRPVHHHLSFSSDTDHTPDNTPACSDSSDEEEEDFQMVPLDDEHWTTEEVPKRTFCIHEHRLPHSLCQYPCPYGSNNTVSYMDSLDLSDILDYKDYMVTSSDEELPGMEEVPYWHWTLVCLNTYWKFQFYCIFFLQENSWVYIS